MNSDAGLPLWATGSHGGNAARQQSAAGMQDKPSPGLLGKSAEEMELAPSLPGRQGQGKGGTPRRVFTADVMVHVPGSECVQATVCCWSSRDHPISPLPWVAHILLLEGTWPHLSGKDPEKFQAKRAGNCHLPVFPTRLRTV